jgi:hypothetical protein
MNEQEDRKQLKRVRKQIDKILKEENLCGYIILETPNIVDFLISLNRSWTCVTYDELTGQVRISSKDIKDPKEKAERIQNTVRVLDGICVLLTQHSRSMHGLMDYVIKDLMDQGAEISFSDAKPKSDIEELREKEGLN